MADGKSLFERLFGSKKEDAPKPGEEYDMKPVKTVPQPYKLGSGISTFELPKFRIKYKGVFDLDKVYRGASNWFKERRYELHETMYKSKPPELELDWRAERKKTGFFKDTIQVHWHLFENYPVEVVEKGVKKQFVEATMTITIWGNVETDYEDIFGESKWQDTNLKRRLLAFYNKFIQKREIDTMQTDVLYYEMYNLQTLLKSLIGMKTTGSAY